MTNRKRFLQLLLRASTPFFLLLSLVLTSLSSPSRAQQPPSVASSQLKEHLKEILAQPEFRSEPDKNPFEKQFRFLQDQWDKLGKWFQSVRDWLNRLFRGSGESGLPVANILVYLVMALLLAGLAIFIVKQIQEYGETRGRAMNRTVFDLEEGDEDSFSRDPHTWMSQAEGYVKAEDFRKAYRAAFIATLLELDIAGMVEFAKSNTNGDYSGQLRKAGRERLSALFVPLVYEFDLRFYGEKETTGSDYAELLKSRGELLEAASKETFSNVSQSSAHGVEGEAV